MQQRGVTRTAEIPEAELVRLISGCPPFAYMSREDIEAFARAGKVVELPRGGSIFHEQEESDAVLVVLDGVAYICSFEADGQQVIEAVLAPVESFAWFSVVDPSERSFSAVMRSGGRLLLIPKQEVNRILDASPAAWRAVARFLAVRLRRSLSNYRALAGFPMDRKIAFVLCQTFRVEMPGHASLTELQLSQDDIARMTSISRQSVNRQLKRWEDQGILRVRYGKLTLLDAAALRDIAFAR